MQKFLIDFEYQVNNDCSKSDFVNYAYDKLVINLEYCASISVTVHYKGLSAWLAQLVKAFVELALRPWVIGHFRSLCYVYGTIFHSTSLRHLPFESLKIV